MTGPSPYPRVSLYALMLAAAGIPLYIHVPRFASVELGISLGTVATILLAIRLIDLVQDPLLGWMIDRYTGAQKLFGALGMMGLAVGFPLLFALPQGASTLSLIMILILLFTSYSLGTILLYGRSASITDDPTDKGLMRVAAFREVGMLIGVIIAAALPDLLGAFGLPSYLSYGFILGAMALLIAVLTAPLWRRPAQPTEGLSLSGLFNSGALGLLGIVFINSLPVAITSTLFLFFVEDKLGLSGLAGPLLILFFLTAGLTVPLWARLANRISVRSVLLIAMPLAILGFLGAAFVEQGNVVGFAIICLASGAALGADMVVLPALFSMVLTKAALNPSAAFGLWGFAGKLGLALAAFLVLPWLEMGGFTPGASNSPEALSRLTFAYAVLPLILKLCALALVLRLPKHEAIS